MSRFPKCTRLLARALGLAFALQVSVAFPAHNAHTAHQHELAHNAPGGEERAVPPLGDDDGHCRFFLAFCSLDSASVAEPPAFGLKELFRSFLPLALGAKYGRPNAAPLARGPPAALRS